MRLSIGDLTTGLAFWHCAHTMRSRVYKTVRCPSVHLSVSQSVPSVERSSGVLHEHSAVCGPRCPRETATSADRAEQVALAYVDTRQLRHVLKAKSKRGAHIRKQKWFCQKIKPRIIFYDKKISPHKAIKAALNKRAVLIIHWYHISSSQLTRRNRLYTGWQWRNFVPLLCQLIFAAIL